jgi:hypothetical protein
VLLRCSRAAMPYAGSLTLSDVAERTDVLAVACSQCERAGRYPLASLIERHGQMYTIPTLLRTLSDDCPKRKSLSAYDLCGVHCPELPALFMRQTQRELKGLSSDPE